MMVKFEQNRMIRNFELFDENLFKKKTYIIWQSVDTILEDDSLP